MRTIAIACQKGGVGKTTTTAAIAQGAVKYGQTALLVDLDPQSNLTHIIGADGSLAGSYDLLQGTPVHGLIQRVRDTQPDIISGNRYLYGIDAELAGKGSNFRLKAGLDPLEGYDLVVLDTPPTLGVVLLNALTAANEVLIPLQVDTFAVQGLAQLVETITTVQERFNPGLRIQGVVLTRYNLRTILARDLMGAIRQTCKILDVPILRTTIREGVAIREAQTVQENLFDYAPKSKPVADYSNLLEELGVTKK